MINLFNRKKPKLSEEDWLADDVLDLDIDDWADEDFDSTEHMSFFGRHQNALAAGLGVLLISLAVTHALMRTPTQPSSVTTNAKGMIIDFSEPLTGLQQELLRQRTEKYIRSLRPNDEVVLFRLTGDTYEPLKIVFNDKFPKGVKFTDRLELDDIELSEKDQELKLEFITEFNEAMKILSQPGYQNNSPIFEALHEGGKFMNSLDAENIYLLVASDWLQNAGGCTHYKDMNSPACTFLMENVNLQNINLEMIYINRAKDRHLQTQEHREKTENFLRSGDKNLTFGEW